MHFLFISKGRLSTFTTGVFSQKFLAKRLRPEKVRHWFLDHNIFSPGAVESMPLDNALLYENL